MTLKTYTHGPKAGGKPDSIVFLLHGLGANGRDLLSLADYWDDLLHNTLFVSPDAPLPCDMGPVGFQWFSLQDWSPMSIFQGVKDGAPALQDYISETLKQYDVPEEKAALVGFSQGTMMSLYAGPRRAQKLAGILGYSGALVGGEMLMQPGIQKPPIHLIHGGADMVVPAAAYHMARTALIHSGFDVSGHMTPWLQHSIDEEGIRSGGEFLASVLK